MPTLLASCSFCGCLIVFICLSLCCLGLDVHLTVSVPEFTYLLYIPRFSLKAFLVLAKKIFKCFLPYMGMAAILFNGAKLLKQTDNIPSTKGPM